MTLREASASGGAPDGYQPPSALQDALAHNGSAPDPQSKASPDLRHGDLLPENVAIFGFPYDIAYWEWADAPQEWRDGGADGGPSGLNLKIMPKRSRPETDLYGALRASPWIGQHGFRSVLPGGSEITDFNADPPRWLSAKRGRRAATPDPDPDVRFVATEELTGRFDQVDAERGFAVCTVWRRRFEHDPYRAQLELSAFPRSQRELVKPGNLFYWTFGELHLRGTDPFLTSRLAVKRPTPVSDQERARALDRARAETAYYRRIQQPPPSP